MEILKQAVIEKINQNSASIAKLNSKRENLICKLSDVHTELKAAEAAQKALTEQYQALDKPKSKIDTLCGVLQSGLSSCINGPGRY